MSFKNFRKTLKNEFINQDKLTHKQPITQDKHRMTHLNQKFNLPNIDLKHDDIERNTANYTTTNNYLNGSIQ